MSSYELRINDERRLVESVTALQALVRAGGLNRQDPVSKDGAPPVPAEQLPELRELFGVNIWSAWDEIDDEAPLEPAVVAEPPPLAVSPEALRPAPPVSAESTPPPAPPKAPRKQSKPAGTAPAPRELSKPTAPAPPSTHVVRSPARAPAKDVEVPQAPVAEAAPSSAAARQEAERASNKRLVIVSSRRGGSDAAMEPEPLPSAAVEPLLLDPQSDPPSDEPRGEVIEFPGPSRPASRPMPRLIEPDDIDARPLQVSREAIESARVPSRYYWMGAFLLLCLGATGIFVWYMRSVALWTRPLAVVESPEVDPPEPPPEPVVPQNRSSEESLVGELRQKIPRDAGSIEGSEEQFGDVLFVELQRVISPRSVHVQVMARTRTGVPEIVEFQFLVNASGDVLRDLGAVALVAGKYKSQYDLQVRRIEVVLVDADGAQRSRELSPEGCSQLWNGKMNLADLLVSK